VRTVGIELRNGRHSGGNDVFKARVLAAGILAVVLATTLAACGGDDDSSDAKDQAAAISKQLDQGSKSAQNASSGDSKGTDLCKLLTDDEVTAVIGAHDKGATGIQSGALYGDGSCIWKATGGAASPDGFPDAVEVSVLTGDIAHFAKQQDAALGEPFASFGHDARYQQSYARLWFDCGDGKYCHVHVDTAEDKTKSGDSRQEAVVKIANKLLDRA
jgi:hypothetical protein